MSNKIDRLWAFAILFINGWNWALPVTSEALPVWFTPVQVVHGVFIHELVLLIYLGVKVVTGGGYLPIRKHAPGNNIACLIIGLGCLGVLSNVANVQPLKEMGEAGRLFLLAAYFLLSIYWAKKHGPTFVLWSLLLGIASAGVINLYYTFTIRFMEVGGLPCLLGQKGPGGSMGLMVILSAWLMLERKRTLSAAVAVVLAGMGVFCASISYSKLAMLMAGFGLIAWGFVIFQAFVDRRSRRLSAVMLIILLTFAFVNHERIIQYVQSVNTFIFYKFHNITTHNRSIESRSQYFITVAEIMLRYPLLGVGYGSFYEAVTATEHYKNPQGVIVEENAEGGESGRSNPHNSFLYYASANGLPGLLLTVLLFLVTLHTLLKAVSLHGLTGKVLWVCLACAYFIYANSVPSLFSTAILYVPAAVAIAITRQSRSDLLLRQCGRAEPIYSKS